MCSRLLITLTFISACFTNASEPETTPVSIESLSLNKAIKDALANNLELIIQRYAPADALDDIIREKAVFDTTLFGTASLSERQAAASSSSLDSASIPESETRRARIGAEKRISTGANITIESDLTRSSSNNNAVRNPDYGSGIGISIRQPLLKDAWARVNLAPIARAKTSAEQSLFVLRSNILDVIADTEIAYWNLAYAQAERTLIASSIELAETLLEENRERKRLGIVTPLEVLQAETELVNQQEDIIQAERAIEDAKDALRRIMGNTSFLNPLLEDITVAKLPESIAPLRDIQTVIAETIRTDADAAASERALEVARINAMLAEDETRLDLDLIAGLDYSGRDQDGETAYRGALNADGYNWNLGMELRLPWGHRDAHARTRQAQRGIERATVRLYDIKQQKAFAARNAWRAVNTGLKRIEVTRQALRLNQESFEQERARYGSGIVAYRRVLEAQRDFDRAKSNYLSAIIDTLRANVRLSRVDGTILARNNYDWQLADTLSTEPEIESHPLSASILNPDS